MTRSTAPRHPAARPHRAAGASALAVAAPLLLGGGLLGGAPASAAATPALALETAQRSATLTRYSVDDGSGTAFTVVEGDLGVHVVARSRPFEVRAERASYDVPVVLTLTVRARTRSWPPRPA